MLGSAKTLLVSLSVVGLVATACGSSTKTSAESTNTTAAAAPETTTTAEAQMPSHHSGDMASFFLKTVDQHSDGKMVVVEDAVLTGTSGWVVINELNGGAMGQILGESARLSPGTTMAVTVPLMHPLTAPAMVVAVLHVGTNATFDPSVDPPAKVAGADVEAPIQVEVP